MSREHLKREPHHVKETSSAWWYEENRGICVVVPALQAVGEDTQFYIPWEIIRAALARKDKKR